MRNEAKQGLDWRREHNRGGTAIGVARARDLSNGKQLPLDTVKRMHSFFSRHAVDLDAPANRNPSDPGYPGAGLIAWKLWGGNAGRSWAKAIIESVEASVESSSVEEFFDQCHGADGRFRSGVTVKQSVA